MSVRAVTPAVVLCLLWAVAAQAQPGGQAERDFAFAQGLYEQENWPLALEKFEAFVQANPNHANAPLALFRCGELRFRQGQYKEACGHFENLVAKHPQSAEAEPGWLWLGESYFQLGQYPEAAAAYDGLLRKFPKSDQGSHAAYWRAESLYRVGQHKEALAGYQDALNRKLPDAEIPYAQYSIGLCQLKLGLAADAARSLQGVVDKYPSSPVAAESQYRLATAQLQAGNTSGALDAFGKVISKFGNSEFAPAAQLETGRAYFAQKDYAKALVAYNETAARYPGTTAAQEAALRAADALFFLNRYPEAAAQYQKVADGPASPWVDEALYWLGFTWGRAGDTTKAVAALQRLVKERPQSSRLAEAQLQMGILQGNAGDWKAAQQAYQAAAKSADPTVRRQAELGAALAAFRQDASPAALDALEATARRDLGSTTAREIALEAAGARYDAGQYDAGANLLGALLTAQAEGTVAGEAWLLLGHCQEKLKHDAEAEKAYQKADESKDAGTCARAKSALAGLYAARGDIVKTQEITAALDKAGAETEAAAYAQYSLGEALRKAGRATEAVGAYTRSLRLAPKGEVSAHATLGLARAKLATGDLSAAQDLQALAAGGAGSAVSAEALLAAADALLKQEKWVEAETVYRQIAQSPATPAAGAEASYKLGWALLKQKKEAAALTAFEEAVTRGGSAEMDADARHQAAWLRYQAGDREHAAALLEPLRDRQVAYDRLPQALALLGRCYDELGKQPEAQRAFEALTARFAENPAAARGWLWLGRQARQKKDWKAADAALQKVLALDAGSLAAQAQYETAACLRDRGELKQAADEFLKVAVLYGEDALAADAQYQAGDCLERSGETQKALSTYQVIPRRYATQTDWVSRSQARVKALQP